jgi:hypothetical protein
MQSYTIFFILVNALHVSGCFFTHYQELKTLHTASDICQACLLLLPAWVSRNSNSPTLAVAARKLDIYYMLCVQFWAPDDGRRSRLKHVEHWQQWRILCNVASCWLYLKEYINDARSHERQKNYKIFVFTQQLVSSFNTSGSLWMVPSSKLGQDILIFYSCGSLKLPQKNVVFCASCKVTSISFDIFL